MSCPLFDYDHHDRAAHDTDDGSGRDASVLPPMLGALRDARSRGPVFRSGTYGGFWGVTSLALVREVFADPGTYSSARTPEGGGGVFIPPFPTPIGLLPGEADPPYNTTLRNAVMKYFRRQAIDAARPRMAALAAEVIAEVVGRGDFDVVADLANVIPARFIVDYLGFPQEQRDQLVGAMRAVGSPVAQDAERSQVAVGMGVLELVARRRGEPADDVASYLVHGPVEFSDLELVAILSNLLLGGVETTAATFVNALLYLEHHRDVRRELISAPERMRSAVKEFLRYFTPIMYAARTVTRDTRLAGVELAEGDRVMLCLQAANHDHEAFESADVIRIDREQHDDVAFGFGVHRCLGHILGETQIAVMLGEFLRQAPGYRIDAGNSRRNDRPGSFNDWLAMPCTVSR